MSEARRVRVGNAGGYWGDDLGALQRQLSLGELDYVTQDFLAEVTMSILQKQRARNPELGYAVDFLDQMRVCLPLLAEKGTRLISNAGGIHPRACALEVVKIAEQAGLGVRIAVVEGDDLMSRLAEMISRGIRFENMETGQPLSSVQGRVESANAYLGAVPVMRALGEGAQIVITGRVTDTGIAAAAPALEFGWDDEDWDRLASAVVAGHILECGAQASGGNLTDWRQVPSFQEMGYPIAEFSPDGSFSITKPEGTGGVVNRKTVSAQLVYEMGNPRDYITPDVVADFSTIQLEDEGPDRVRISGVRGRPRTDQLKVSIAYHHGYKAHGTMIVSCPGAAEKCRSMAGTFWKRLALDFEETRTELVGYNACHRLLARPVDPPEILLRLGVRDPDAGKVKEFSKLFTSLILNTVPGVAIVGARPRVQDVVAYWPCLIPASEICPRVTILETGKTFRVPWSPLRSKPKPPPPQESPLSSPTVAQPDPSPGRHVRLVEICYARSGDKGDTCNIGVVARSPETYDWLCGKLTSETVKEHFKGICQGRVERFEVPNLLALNFLLHRCLGGGGTVSLRIDPQGKTLADALLMMEVEIPKKLIDTGHSM
ncbi:MAG: acyclic terpene utilization AtuA family protein [Acidobacteriota bacterium]